MITTNTTQNILLFWRFFKRDWYVHTKQLRAQFINFSLLYPLQYAICFAYLQAQTYFGTDAKQATIFFAGTFLITCFVLSFRFTIDLLFDLLNNRFINYQITILHPRLVIFERIIFASIFSFMLSIPFYPVAKLMLQHKLDTSNTSWIQLVVVLYFGSLCCATYHQCAALVLKRGEQISSLWARVNLTLICLGGFWVPLHTMQKFSPLLGKLVLLNPALYISEGLRQAVVGGPKFLPFWQCIIALLIFSVGFTLASWYLFKKRVDHI